MNQADTAWMLVSTALVLLMTPALAFFYGGLVRSKNALNTMMMSFISLGFVGVLWAVVGYSLAFAPGNNWIGDLSRVFLHGVGLEPQGTIPHLLFMCYQGTFAIITAALISGAIVERMRFSAYVVFIMPLGARRLQPGRALGVGRRLAGRRWARSTSPAAPSCTSTPASPRWSRRSASASARDYPSSAAAAAQRAVHAARRRAALVRLVRVQRRQRAGGQRHPPRWRSRRRCWRRPGRWSSGRCSTRSRQQKPTAVGAATAIVVGLVAITPAAGFVGPMSAIALGGAGRVPELLRA